MMIGEFVHEKIETDEMLHSLICLIGASHRFEAGKTNFPDASSAI